jgi:hypothetical protein
MKLHEVTRDASPLASGRVRLTGHYSFGPLGEQHETLWFDVPVEQESFLSTTGNPWLACLLPMAVTLGEPLEICLPVDRSLRETVVGLMHAWRTGYPWRDYQMIEIEADLLEPSHGSNGQRTLSFFTGGVDSFFTVLRHQPDGDAINRVQIDDLLTVWGFDIPLADGDAFERLVGRNQEIAAVLGHGVVTIATNLRESAWQLTHWGEVGQGAGLAGLALALEHGYSKVLVPSSVGYNLMLPYGTHPFLDQLLSTTTLRIEDDAASFTRQQKLEALTGSSLAMSNLRVCWEGKNDRNCGSCEKCLRTMAALELCDSRHLTSTFPTGAWSVDALASTKLRNRSSAWSRKTLAANAKMLGHRPIERAARKSARRFAVRCFISELLRGGRR